MPPFFSNGPANKRRAGPSCDGRRIAGASFGDWPEAWEASRRGGNHSPLLSGWCRRRRRSLVEHRAVRMKPRCTLQAHDVASEY